MLSQVTRFPVRNATPDHAMPPGRIPYDLAGDTLLLHSLQDPVVLDVLENGDRWTPDPTRAEPEFAEAYSWLYGRMAERLGQPVTAAVWFWAKTTRRALVNDCMIAARQGEPTVLLTCRVPCERLVVSHFSDWHLVLNRSFHVHPRPDETTAAWERRWEHENDALDHALRASGHDPCARGSSLLGDWPLELRAQIEASWEPILEPAAYGASARRWPDYWQATTPYLDPAEVVEAVRIQPG